MSSKNFMAYDDAVSVLTEYASDIKGKTDKVTSAINGDLASLDTNGNLSDSGIASTNVVVKSATVGLIKNDGAIDTNTYLTDADIADKADIVENATDGDLAGLDANGNLTDSGVLVSDILVKSNTAGLIKNDGTIDTNSYATTTQLADKADKVANATNGNLAGLDSNGNLTDSGVVTTDIIQKVATATGLLRDDGTVDTSTYATTTNAYLVNDTAETTLDDTDYVPFYDTSATAKRKTLWSNIKSVLKTYFDTLYSNKISNPTAGKFVTTNSNGELISSNTDWDSFSNNFNMSYKESTSANINWTHDGVTTAEVLSFEDIYRKNYSTMGVKSIINTTLRLSQTVTLSTSDDTTVMFGGNYYFDNYSITPDSIIAPSSGTRDKICAITTSINDISYKSCEINTTNHTCTIVFPSYSSAVSMDVEIFLY